LRCFFGGYNLAFFLEDEAPRSGIFLKGQRPDILALLENEGHKGPVVVGKTEVGAVLIHAHVRAI
jgi:hypothetical protein